MQAACSGVGRVRKKHIKATPDKLFKVKGIYSAGAYF
jgi:hypothetical protein